MARVLVVDDEQKITKLLEGDLADVGHHVTTANDGETAVRLLRTKRFDVVVTDLRLGAVDGLAVLRAAKESDDSIVVLLMTAYATVPSAVAAMRDGASDYLEKPVHFDKLRFVLDRELTARRLAADNVVLRAEVRRGETGADNMVTGRSAAIRQALELARKVAPTEANVLITGESGTGKEVVARVLHQWSSRRDRSLVSVNCAALSETLLESELFGHEKGAFTDAHERRLGWFEVAEGGTIFLDEIGEMKPSTQAKLLRVLEDRRFHRLGGSAIIDVDVRVLAATNRDLAAAIASGEFREDLFYRLNVFPIHLPPLRERRDDVEELVQHFLARSGYEGPGPDRDARDALRRYDWPGNIRELRNVVERAVILAGNAPITPDELHLPERRGGPVIGPASAGGDEATLSGAEERMIRDALARADGNKSQAARLLGITRRALYGRLEKYGIDAD
jgi:DNA-binding NtrC family response regulator